MRPSGHRRLAADFALLQYGNDVRRVLAPSARCRMRQPLTEGIRVANPYQSPSADSLPQRPTPLRRSTWPIWAGVAWTLFLFLFLPSISLHSSTPDGALLWFKLLTSGISFSAAFGLLTVPRGLRKLFTLPVVALLLVAQYAAWTMLP